MPRLVFCVDKVTVTPDRTISGSYGLVAIGPRCDRSAIFATISSSGRISRSISRPTRGRAITNDWRISMARTIAGNRATGGSDQRPMYDGRRLVVRSIDRCIRRPIVRAIVAYFDRSYDHS